METLQWWFGFVINNITKSIGTTDSIYWFSVAADGRDRNGLQLEHWQIFPTSSGMF